MKIILNGLEGVGIPDGEYELDPGPTAREEYAFRREAGMSPSDFADVFKGGGFDVVRYYAFVALLRNPETEIVAGKVFDIPLEMLDKIEVEIEEDEKDLPPADGSVSSGSEKPSGELPSTTSSESSALPA